MKHFIPLTICTVAVLALLPVAVAAHHGYIHQLTVQNARSAALQAKADLEAKFLAHKQAAAVQAKQDKLEKSCKLGLNAYNMLNAYQKKSAVKPDCSV